MDVIVVDIDSLRPDHVGAYGYEPPTTPALDEVAADGVRFERAYAANSPCMPSRAALLSGRYGLHNGIATHGPSGQDFRAPWSRWDWPDDGPGSDAAGTSGTWWTLPELCFEHRWRTVAVTSFPRHPAPWFAHLWDELHEPREPAGEGEYFQTVRAEAVVDRALDVLERYGGDGSADGTTGDEDLLLYCQLWEPHAPYNRPEGEIERFRKPPVPPHPTDEQIATHRQWDAWRCATQQGIADRDDLAALLSAYDAEIRHADDQLRRLFDRLAETDRYDDAMIVVTADHGEEFGEHGLYREHWSTYDGTQRVPLIVKPPGGGGGGPRNELVTNVDLPTTVADYADLAAPAGWQGRSLRPAIEGTTEWRDAVVVDHGLYTAQRAVRTDRWKLIRTYHPGMYGGILPERQLFDLAADPWEQTDVAGANPDVVDRLERRLTTWTVDHRGPDEDALRAVARTGPAGYRFTREDWTGV